MTVNFINLCANRSLPFQHEYKGTYQLGIGCLLEGKRRIYLPIAEASKLVKMRIVIRGRFPFSFFTESTLQANIVRNDEVLEEGQVKFRTKSQAGVKTRHQTSIPNVYFEKDDTLAIEIKTLSLLYEGNQLYLSGYLMFQEEK